VNTRLADTSVNLRGLSKGMYIVSVGGQNFKIFKK
jgi:hypothetical protein